jgi:hypothetical protein
MSLSDFLSAAKEALAVVGKVLAYVCPSNESHDPSLREIIHQARADATHECHHLHHEIGVLRAQLRRIGVEIDLPEQEATETFLETAGWVGRYRLRRAGGRLLNLREELGRLASDIESILVCAKHTKALVAGSRTASAIRQQLDEFAAGGTSVSEQLGVMEQMLGGFLNHS